VNYITKESKKWVYKLALYFVKNETHHQPLNHLAGLTWTNELYRHQSKMSSSKKSPVKGLRSGFLSEFIGWRYSQSCRYFRPSFVNCCPSNLLSGSTLPPPPLPCVNKYTVYTYTMCWGGGGMGFWASDR
jgi:hypothetical protein